MDTPDQDFQKLLETLDPTTRTLVAEADLGVQAKEFAQSDIGKFMVGAAQQEIAEAQEHLSKVYPWRRRKIQDLQNRIWRSKFFLSLLCELLMSGRVAQGAIEESEG